MTDTDLQSKLAEREDVIRQLVTKLQETVDENDRLRAELARATEGSNALATLQALYRDPALPESLRAKCAIGCLPHETPRLTPQPPPLDLTAAPIPLAELVALRRARAEAMAPKLIEQTARDNEAAARAWRNSGNGSGDNNSND